ncbi:hypothetical protein VI817_007361 [Penicillium citrinum]|nr:hypothetical protein VI817_007361 [Penicillium citrinum]
MSNYFLILNMIVMHEYVLYGHQVHPFFSHVINAAVSHTALMSTKILNASAWDDLNTEGQISDLTLQQHVITRKLLGQVLEDVELACSEPTLAALVATLLFDVLLPQVISPPPEH